MIVLPYVPGDGVTLPVQCNPDWTAQILGPWAAEELILGVSGLTGEPDMVGIHKNPGTLLTAINPACWWWQIQLQLHGKCRMTRHNLTCVDTILAGGRMIFLFISYLFIRKLYFFYFRISHFMVIYSHSDLPLTEVHNINGNIYNTIQYNTIQYSTIQYNTI